MRSGEPLGRHAHAGLERAQVLHVRWILPWLDQRAAVQIERMNHHQVVAQPEILDRQALRVDQASVARGHLGELTHAIGIAGGIVGVSQAELAAPNYITEFIDGSGIRTGSAKRREIGDDGTGLVHHGLVAAENLHGSISGCDVEGVVQRIKSDQSMTRAKLDLAPPDINGIGQENVGASQVNLHGV